MLDATPQGGRTWPPIRTECTTQACREKAQSLTNYLDWNVDPCDDFFAHVCQRWINRTEIPEDQGVYGTFYFVDDVLMDDVKEVLSLRGSENGASGITVKIRDAYRACMDESIPENEKLNALSDVMNSVGIRNWPHTDTTDATPEWQQTFKSVTSELGITPIFNMDIAQDSKNITSYILQLDQMYFANIGRNQLIEQTRKDNIPIVEAYKRYVKDAVRAMNPHMQDETEGRQIAEEILKFESELAKRTRPDEERRDHEKMYLKLRISKLQEDIPQVQWIIFLNDILSKAGNGTRVTSDDYIVILERQYYKSAMQFLQTQNRRIVHNYIGWKILSTLGPYTTDTFADLELKYLSVTSGITKRQARWKQCIAGLGSYAEHAVGRLYVEKKFSEGAKQDVTNMVNILLDTFTEMLNSTDWMDHTTKGKAIRKVKQIASRMAYPDWIMNKKKLEELYRHVSVFPRKTSYVKIFANLLKNVALVNLAKIHKTYNKTLEWASGAAVVNAFYDPGTNVIEFPAGILRPPFYEHGLPMSLNLGGIGMIVGHEITHAFDDEGSQYDADGRLYNWWDEKTKERFKEKAQCFIAQYGGIVDAQANKTLNGINTQGENIADNGGLRAALKAYQKLKAQTSYQSTYLPGYENITEDKMFFISNAMMWCQKYKKGYLEQIIQYEQHSPAQYRVNVPMSNLKEFSDAFSCDHTRPMNARKKCAVW